MNIKHITEEESKQNEAFAKWIRTPGHFFNMPLSWQQDLMDYVAGLNSEIADSRAYALRLKGLLKEISSKTAANSIMVDDGIGDQKMAVLIEDINDLLNQADQI